MGAIIFFVFWVMLILVAVVMLEELFLETFLEVDYKKHSLFYKYIVKRFYNCDEE